MKRYMILAFLFSVLVRCFYFYEMSSNESYLNNGVMMLNTQDAYHYAKGVRDILEGQYVAQGLSQLGAVLSFILPFGFESVMLWMSAIFGSLIVVPLVLIGKEIGDVKAGFIASLVASVSIAYYSRTTVGYFDTDMLNLFFPLMLVWLFMVFLKNRDERYILLIALDIVFYRWWYPPSYSLEFAFFALMLLYTLVYRRKDEQFYKLLALMLLAMMNLPDILRFFAVLVGFYYLKNIKILFVVAVGFFVVTGGLNPIFSQLDNFVFSSEVSKDELSELPLHFYTVFQTISETAVLPFLKNVHNISGSLEVFIFSLFGYVWLIFKYPKVLISLPLLGLGFLSFIGGMRFGMYAVPILSLGFGYALTSSCRAFEQKLQGERSAKLMSMTIAVIVIMYALIPHIGYVASFRPSTVVDGNEVKLINNANVKEDDYILGWWDNGYVLKYFTRANVTIDGRKFQGSQTFPFSFALFTDQESASRMLLLDVAYEQKRREMAKQKQPKDGKKISSSNFIWMMIDRGYENPNEFLKDLKKQSVEPQSDVYLYLPYAMLDFVPNILLFSNLDLMSGEKYQEPFYFFSPYAIAGDRIYFIDGVSYEDGKIYHEDRSWSIGKIISVINKEISSEDIGDGSLVWVRFEGGNLFVDESRLDETYIQLLVFGNVDGRFFELVSENSAGKIYKVKR